MGDFEVEMLEQGKWYSSPNEIKIHTYVICKNEDKFVDDFMETVKDTDSLSVMDTGSNDGTYEHFLKYLDDPRWRGRLFVWQQEVKPWRFDVARNLSMEKMPEDTDYCYCIDLDERLTPGFYQKLREVIFNLGYIPQRIFYKYAWNHYADGAPNAVFWYDKTHGAKGWKWEFPCHESLQLDEKYAHLYGRSVNIDDGSTIWLHHWPDQYKSRGSYLGLLRMRADEYPDDLYGLFYLGREEGFVNNWEAALKEYTRLYIRLSKPGVIDDMLMKPVTALAMADAYAKLGMKEEARHYYEEGIRLEPALVDGYVKYAQWLVYQGCPIEALEWLNKGRRNGRPSQDWRTVPYLSSKWKANQILAGSLCWLGFDDEASEIIEEAKAEVELCNAEYEANTSGFYNDYEFIKNKANKK